MTTSMDLDGTATDPLVSMPPIDAASDQQHTGPLGTLSREELQMLEFARRWAPFGGARSSDVLVEFGLTGTHFYTRIRRILEQLETHT